MGPELEFRDPPASSLLDRIAGSLIALVFMALTILLLPLVAAAYVGWNNTGGLSTAWFVYGPVLLLAGDPRDHCCNMRSSTRELAHR